MTDWRDRWEKTSAELAASRAECLRLREALDDLNEETEEIVNAAATSDHVKVMAWTIRRLRGRVRELKDQIKEMKT